MPKKQNHQEEEASAKVAPADPSFPEWLKGRLRFGLADDCVILFIPSHARDKKRPRIRLSGPRKPLN
jgi:hypothetical protein